MPNLLGMQNAIIDLDMGKPVMPRPEQFIRTVAPIYYDPDATCPLWEKTVDEILDGDQEKISYLRRQLGYAMSGIATESDFYVWYGKEGRNGKELILNVIGEVLGPVFTGVFDIELLLVGAQTSKNAPTEQKMALRSRRIAWASETAPGRIIDVAAMKDYSGGVKMYGRHNHGGQQEWYRVHTLFFLTNHLPHINSSSDSEWDRIKLLEFPFTFTNDPDPDKPWQKKKDTTLFGSMTARELPGIFNWLLQGYHEYRENGLATPFSVSQATKGYKDQEDSLGFFMTECCVRGTSTMIVRRSELYEVYLEHMGRERPMSRRKFYVEIARRPGVGLSSDTYYFTGIGIKKEFQST